MKEAITQLSVYTMNIYAPDFHCDTDSGSDGPAAADQGLPPIPDLTLQLDLGSNQYQFPPLISD